MNSRVIVSIAVVSLMAAGQALASPKKGSSMGGSSKANIGSAQSVSANSMMVGNKHCPVSGEELESMGQIIPVEYKGKVYNLCCKMCKKEFLKNPKKYIKKAEDDVKMNGKME